MSETLADRYLWDSPQIDAVASELERLGVTFMKLEERVADLTETFGLEKSDLNLTSGRWAT